MMGESIFIDPIKRWFSSRNNKNVTSTPQGAALTPEQQFAQMRGMLGNAPAPSDAGSGASGAVTAPPNAALQGSKIATTAVSLFRKQRNSVLIAPTR
ncbi:MAG: hypothetical protein CM1200mP22_28960 [Dehalococcoidia bacterium]|nr:MAG: hypothetical protein CM1200mP22_28960 [Dehalococcoidia bacterium]